MKEKERNKNARKTMRGIKKHCHDGSTHSTKPVNTDCRTVRVDEEHMMYKNTNVNYTRQLRFI